ncbi:hypothetical protein FKW77_000330 [Venturia effusa]|uniref:Uncharacterized protein n=1 Tax=Venturia effusa TaxID=50376 RepID=A0A517LA79_9PEZI|nr:hypothetical protein FKW77_000330 [Venturia effusa]
MGRRARSVRRGTRLRALSDGGDCGEETKNDQPGRIEADPVEIAHTSNANSANAWGLSKKNDGGMSWSCASGSSALSSRNQRQIREEWGYVVWVPHCSGPVAKILKDAYDWDTMAQAPDAKERQRGPSAQPTLMPYPSQSPQEEG